MPNSLWDAGNFWRRADRVLLTCSPLESEVVVAGNGTWLTTVSGKRLLDLGAGQVCATFGHSNPEITKALVDQTQNLVHCGARFVSQVAVDAAEAVLEIVPSGLTKVCFLSTGSEANEFAIRLAKLATQRTGVAAAAEGYLGTSLMLRGLSRPFIDELSSYPKPADCHIFSIDHASSVSEVIKEVRFTLDGVANRLAAIIVEPILGTHGIWPLKPGLLRELRTYADEIGALLILDEAQTGLGRTGAWFACQHEEVIPDILVFSKCAGNGYPVACVVLTDALAQRVLECGIYHISSHQADPLACRAVLATVTAARRYNAPDRASYLGMRLRQGIEAVAANTCLIGEVRGRGLLLGVECRGYGLDTHADLVCRRIFQQALAAGVIFGYGDWGGVMRLAPPLTISEDEIDLACNVLLKAVRQVEDELAHSAKLPRWANPNPLTQRFFAGLETFIRTKGEQKK